MPFEPSISDPCRRDWIFAGNDSPFQRLDQFLRNKIPGLSRRRIHGLIAESRVRVNQQTGVKGTLLRVGDRIELRLPGPLNALLVPEPTGMLALIYEDSDLIVAEKPAPVPSHPLSPFETGTLANALVARFPELSGVGTKPLEAGLIHRLDIGTSGILIAARNPAAWARLKQDLARRLWKKKYLALVSGITELKGVVNQPLAHHPTDRRRMVALKDPKDPHRGRIYPAETRFLVLKRFRDYCLLEADLITGVTHQIRVHLAEWGHPIAGDLLYGEGGPPVSGLAPGRLFLHAASVELLHPLTREKLFFQSGLPEDLLRFSNSLT